jgi:hypothetical protein
MMFFSRNNKKTEKVQQEKSRNILSLSPMGSAKYSFSFEKVQEKEQSGYHSNTSEEDSSVEDNNSPYEERKEASSPVPSSSSSKHSSMGSSKKSWMSGSATSHLSTSTTSTNAEQRQIIVDSTVSIRKSLNFSNNNANNSNGESMEIIRGSVDEMLLHRPLPVLPSARSTTTATKETTETERVSSVSIEVSQYKMILIKFLREKVLCTQKNAYHYADMLIKNGILTIDDLEKKLEKDDSFLLNIGFDEEDHNEIKEYYVTRCNTKNNRDHKSLPQQSSSPLRLKSVASGLSLTRYDSNLSALSVDSSCCNSPISPVAKSKLSIAVPGSSSLSSTDVAQLYYDASQCNIIVALEQLREIAADGHLLAQGYLMRMYAIGQGNIKKDVNKAILLAEAVFSYLAEVIALASSGKSSLLSFVFLL